MIYLFFLEFRVHMEEKEHLERKSGVLMNRLQDLFMQLGVTLGTDFGQSHSSAFEKLVTRVRTDYLIDQ